MSAIRTVCLVCAILALPFVACGPPPHHTPVTLVNQWSNPVLFIIGSDPPVTVQANTTHAVIYTSNLGPTNVTVETMTLVVLITQSCTLQSIGNTITFNEAPNSTGALSPTLTSTSP